MNYLDTTPRIRNGREKGAALHSCVRVGNDIDSSQIVPGKSNRTGYLLVMRSGCRTLTRNWFVTFIFAGGLRVSSAVEIQGSGESTSCVLWSLKCGRGATSVSGCAAFVDSVTEVLRAFVQSGVPSLWAVPPTRTRTAKLARRS
jgi:hypothetical protein